MNTPMIRILLVVALLMNGIMVAHASVSMLVPDAEAAVAMTGEPACHETVAGSESPDNDGAMPCCQAGHCHCLVMQMTGVESLRVLPVPAGPLALTDSLAYRSPVSPLMLRPPIA